MLNVSADVDFQIPDIIFVHPSFFETNELFTPIAEEPGIYKYTLVCNRVCEMRDVKLKDEIVDFVKKCLLKNSHKPYRKKKQPGRKERLCPN